MMRKWETCDQCTRVVDRLFALWVQGSNAGGMEASRITREREHLARWLYEHRSMRHARQPDPSSGAEPNLPSEEL